MNVFVSSHTAMDSTIKPDEVGRVGGLYAGICYSSYPFSEKLAFESPESSIRRYASTISNKHFSVGHNYQITVIFEGISKMMAIILNSFTFYNTCERSGRYTNMSNGNPDYDRWLNIFEKLISEEYPNMPTVQVNKLAMENARYTLPLFNKMTTLAYTTSYVQYNFICNFFQRFIDRYERGDRYLCFDIWNCGEEDYGFYEELIPEMKDIIEALRELNIFDDLHTDNKNREITLFEDVRHFTTPDIGAKIIGRTYETVDAMSYPILADLIRHRTTELSIVSFSAKPQNKSARTYHVPEILYASSGQHRDDLLAEWNWMMKRSTFIRQGHTILVRETGRIDKFALKAKERLCGRVQLEAMRVVEKRVINMAKEVAPLVHTNPYAYDAIAELIDIPSLKLRSKCSILGGCVESCFFSGEKAFGRRV